jgi:hypothetical protein
MNTNNMSDEELDQLFRESAEGYDPPFNPAAWADMDQRLDAHQAGKGRGAWFYPLLILLLFLCLLSVPTLFNQHLNVAETLASAPETEQNKSLGKPSSEPKQAKPETTTTQPIAPLASDLQSSEPAENYAQKKVQASRFSPDFQKTNQKRSYREKLLPRLAIVPGRKNRALNTRVNKTVEDGKRTNNRPEAAITGHEPETVALQEEGNAAKQGAEAGTSTAKNQEAIMVRDSSSMKAPAAGLPADGVAQDSLPEQKNPAVKEKHFLKHVQVGIALAPDFTTVKFKGADRISPNVGMLVAVPLTKRFSLVTGAVWAKKIYATAPEYYTPPAGTTFAYENDIEAVCRVLDIPVNVRYTFWQKGTNSLALQAGLSSYVMLNEKYTYQYTASYGYGNPPKTYTKTWEVDNENRHWFQVQNLSVSYTRTFASGFSLGVEPFVKLPLSGIGAGKVNLTSAGVFFSTSYSFHLKP